jgi:ArsR family transcriptional regulator, arsenate/arsenite/antimonite-responsive transcriptional repressor
MSKRMAPARDLPLLDEGETCPPLVSAPVSADLAPRLAAVFKALSDPVRLRLLSVIATHRDGTASVGELTDQFDVSQPTISHHLKVLREAGLVTAERRGVWAYYRIVPEMMRTLATVFAPAAG